MADSDIGFAVARALAEALETNRCLTTLILSCEDGGGIEREGGSGCMREGRRGGK